MKRLLLLLGATVAAGGVAAAPAVAGLADNPSFSHQIPVRAPSQAQVPLLIDDHGRDGGTPIATPSRSGHLEPGDDRSATSTTTVRSSEPGDDRGGATRHAEPGDDRGGAGQHVEPGDDRGGAQPQPTDDRGGSTRHAEPGDDHGGSTANPAPGDDRGGEGGHGGGDG